MKQVIVLEPSDVQRLKGGETLQLTGSLMLSLQGGRAHKPVDVQTLTPKQVYQREYREKRKQRNDAKSAMCRKCHKIFSTPNALGPHKRHCPGAPQ